MATELSNELLRELCLPTTEDFVFVDVPELQFVIIDGEGSPEGEQWKQAAKWLFSVIHPIKLIARERMGKDFVEPPLEGLWWADEVADLVAGNTARLKWRLMIVTADWVDQEMFEEGRFFDEREAWGCPGQLEAGAIRRRQVGPNHLRRRLRQGSCHDRREASPRVLAPPQSRPQRAPP